MRSKDQKTQRREVRSGYSNIPHENDYLSSEYLRDAKDQRKEVDSLDYIKALCSHLSKGSFSEWTDAEHAARNRLKENAYWMIPYLLKSLEEAKTSP